MKKLITLLSFLASTYMLNAQCQAGFGYQTDPITSVTSLNGYVTTNDSNAFPINYTWMFGDGSSGTGQYLTHSFNTLGFHTVCLTIQTANGCSSTFCDSILVGNMTPCSASFTALIDSVVPSGTWYNFTNYSVPDSGATIVSYLWDFGDGTTTTTADELHDYTQPGTYMVCLTINTSSGCTSSTCQYVYVNNGGQNTTCQAGFYSYVDSITVPPMTSYNFVDLSVPDSSNSIVSWTWTFQGGTPATSTTQNPYGVIFPNPGTYNICLSITTSGGCTSNYCEMIVVGNTGCQLYANLAAQSPTTIGGNDGFIESNVYGGTPPYTYAWSNGATTAGIYNLTSGIYTLNVGDANGCANSFTAMLYEPYDTTGGQIIDTLTTNILDTCLNFIPDSFYIASVTTDPNTNIVTIIWTFTGGGMTTSLTVEYTYIYTGNNAIVLTINCGTKALATYLSFIHIYETAGILPVYGNDNDIAAYPVPFMDKLNIAFAGSGNVNIIIYDATGRIALIEPTFVANGAVNKEINTSNLPSGVYILNIENNGTVIHKQIIK